MPDSTAFVFPGQGSQYVGMGAGLYAAYTAARQTFEEANDRLGFNLSNICFNGPEPVLTETSMAQPALYVCGIAALRVFNDEIGDSFTPRFTAGHSLGELTALTASGALDFADGLGLVRKRGELMRDADVLNPGGMAAILGIPIEQVEQLCDQVLQEIGGILVIANDNCPGQTVISGDNASLRMAVDRAKDYGAKRAVLLPVSIGAHSPLMAHIQDEFRDALASTQFRNPAITLIGNTTAQPLNSVEAIQAELANQLTSRVRWTESIQALQEAGISTYVELGSRDVLTGLLKRIDRSATGYRVDSPDGIRAILAVA
nr:ACP S-malonyltransferase [Anaerolineae bacterium]